MSVNKKYLILAGGDESKWENALNTTRHMVPIKGEPLIHRTQRLFLENGASDIFVCCNEGKQDSYVLTECHYLPSPPCVGKVEEDALAWHYQEYLNTEGTTVILYGDCYYTEELVNAIINDSGEIWHLYARWGASVITKKPYSEMFAWVVGKHDLDWLLECSEQACGMPAMFHMGPEQTDYITYRLMTGVELKDDWPDQPDAVHWINWDDESDDFDLPRDVQLLEEVYNRE